MRRAIRNAGSLALSLVLVTGISSLGGPVVPNLQAQESPTAQGEQAGKTEPSRRVVNRRDPFRSLLVGPDDPTGGKPLPPGKRGLVIPQLTITGIVVMPAARIAVVSMRGKNRAYFLRERDQVYNGYVARITADGVVFKERATDAFGKQYEREVVKSLFGSGAQ